MLRTIPEYITKYKGLKISWDLVAHPVTQIIGEQALVDILDLSEVAWTCWGVSTGAEDGEGIRPAAGTGNE